MKNKITLLLLIGVSLLSAQQKSTGVVTLSTNMVATLTLDNGTSTATLSLTGPNDRWFALQFGSFTGGMAAGSDLVYWDNVTLVDARHVGIGSTPTTDATNNWTITSNLNNSPSAGLRTIVATRAFNTGDSNDFAFNFSDTSIDFAWARMGSATYSLAYHGGTNRDVSSDRTFTLGTESFSLNDSQLYPNPSNGNFTIIAKTNITKVNVYTITGAFVKSIEVSDNANNTEVNVSGLETGVYLLELQNDAEKSWKKVIVN